MPVAVPGAGSRRSSFAVRLVNYDSVFVGRCCLCIEYVSVSGVWAVKFPLLVLVCSLQHGAHLIAGEKIGKGETCSPLSLSLSLCLSVNYITYQLVVCISLYSIHLY